MVDPYSSLMLSNTGYPKSDFTGLEHSPGCHSLCFTTRVWTPLKQSEPLLFVCPNRLRRAPR